MDYGAYSGYRRRLSRLTIFSINRNQVKCDEQRGEQADLIYQQNVIFGKISKGVNLRLGVQ